MSKEPNKPNKEQPTKIDMSFEDAIRLAMKTKPLMTIEFEKLGEVKEVPNVTGSTVTLTSIEVPENNVYNYIVNVHVKALRGTIESAHGENVAFTQTPNDLDTEFIEFPANQRHVFVPDGYILILTLTCTHPAPVFKGATITYNVTIKQ